MSVLLACHGTATVNLGCLAGVLGQIDEVRLRTEVPSVLPVRSPLDLGRLRRQVLLSGVALYFVPATVLLMAAFVQRLSVSGLAGPSVRWVEEFVEVEVLEDPSRLLLVLLSFKVLWLG